MRTLLLRAWLLVTVAAAIGLVHSWVVPVVLVKKAPAQDPVVVPDKPQQPADGSQTGDESKPDDAQTTPDDQQHTDQPPPQQDDTTTPPDTGTPDALGTEISLDQARQLWEEGISFLDTRQQDVYEAGHVSGAFHLSADMVLDDAPVMMMIDPDATIVLYCEGGECDASHNTATLLGQLGFSKIHIMTAGYDAWAEAGGMTETGPDPAAAFDGGEG